MESQPSKLVFEVFKVFKVFEVFEVFAVFDVFEGFEVFGLAGLDGWLAGSLYPALNEFIFNFYFFIRGDHHQIFLIKITKIKDF